MAQLIRENKFYDENERLRLFSPDRYSIRLHPGEGGITGIWDEVLERFCGDGEQTLRFAEQNNAIGYLDGIKRDMGIELSPPAFTTPLGYTVRPEPLTAEEAATYLAGIDGVALASDAFFPFDDNIVRARRSGVRYVAQPGGSIRDDLVIDRCDRYGMVMSFTGLRLFHH